jgi:hypothetical protein
MRKTGSALILAFMLAVATAPAAMADGTWSDPSRVEQQAVLVGSVIELFDNTLDRLGDQIINVETRLADPTLTPWQESSLEAKQVRLEEAQSYTQEMYDLLLQWVCDPNGVLLPLFMSQCGWE